MSLVPAFEIGVWNAWIFMSSFILQMLAVLLWGKRVWASFRSTQRRITTQVTSGLAFLNKGSLFSAAFTFV